MGKILISLKLLGEQNFVNSALIHAELLSEEKSLNKELIITQIKMAKNSKEFKDTFELYFNKEIKLIF